MKKFLVCLVAAIAIVGAASVVISRHATGHDQDVIIAAEDNGTAGTEYDPIEDSAPITPPVTVNGGQPLPSEPGEPWLPPEEFLTEEEKELRRQLIAAAGLDPDDPDFEQKLLEIYSATDSTQFPNAETYGLITDHILRETDPESADRGTLEDPSEGIRFYTDENGVKHGFKNDNPGPGPNVNNGVGSYVGPMPAQAALADEVAI